MLPKGPTQLCTGPRALYFYIGLGAQPLTLGPYNTKGPALDSYWGKGFALTPGAL